MTCNKILTQLPVLESLFSYLNYNDRIAVYSATKSLKMNGLVIRNFLCVAQEIDNLQ